MRSVDPPQRILLGPGPSSVPPSVLRALASPTIGHLDPEYLAIMDELREMLRSLFQTRNEITLAVSGTGSAGMETCVVNLVEPGDEVIIGVNGVFGGRMREVAQRSGATVHALEVPWGEVIPEETVARAIEEHPGAKVVGIVHAETSTGAHQPLEAIGQRVRGAGMLFLVDAVTSLGGTEVSVDAWNIDACYSGTQKCLSCPPGLAPVTFSPAALEAMDRRRGPVQSWYLDVSLLRGYWGADRVYHHTAPVNMSYALHEAVRRVLAEGLPESWARHLRHHRALRAGLEALGLEYIPRESLPMLNAVRVPEGVGEAQVRGELLARHGIEIGAGLGPYAGQAWRIGLMGHSCSRRNVTSVLSALESELAAQGWSFERGASAAAADAAY